MRLQRSCRLVTPPPPPAPKTFRRFEFGARLEVPSSNSFFTSPEMASNLDPKFKARLTAPTSDQEVVEFRTFCCCRDGLVCETEFDGFSTFSGRADVEPTGRSNIGFNARLLSPEHSAEIGPEVLAACKAGKALNGVSLEEADFDAVYGEAGGAILKQGIEALISEFPSLGAVRFEIKGRDEPERKGPRRQMVALKAQGNSN